MLDEKGTEERRRELEAAAFSQLDRLRTCQCVQVYKCGLGLNFSKLYQKSKSARNCCGFV